MTHTCGQYFVLKLRYCVVLQEIHKLEEITVGYTGLNYLKSIIASSVALIFGFSGVVNATNEILGDFNGDGNQDAFVQAINPGEASKIEAKQGVPDLLYHRTWTTTHPDIPAIPDWSADSYTALSENLNSSPGDELLLLGHNKIILLHDDIITPILIPKSIRNAIISWTASGTASFASFDLDVDPNNFNPQFADFDGDGDKEIFIQNKSTRGTSYIVTGEGLVSQTLVNGYLGTDWSMGSTIVLVDENGDGRVDMRITDASGNVTVVYASGSGTFVTNPVPLEPGYAKKFSGTVDDADLSTPTVPANQAVGAVEGQAGVSGGAASYQIPIALPPGRNKMQPSVAIGYSSRGGNGVVGVGFSLSAGSAISRCSSTAAQDEANLGVQYHATNDRLCLNGSRLIKVSGNYGESGTEYRTEIDSFVTVTQKGGGINDATTYFEAQSRTGNITTFGKNSRGNNSKVIPAGAPATLSWLIDSERDLSNNAVHYDYQVQTNPGEVLLTQISYTGTSDGVTEALGNRYVSFEYGPRTDVSSSYLAGGLSRRTKRLEKIITKYNTTPIREYNLVYKYSGATNKSLLSTIQECGYRAASTKECLPKTEFSWMDDAVTYELEAFTLTKTDGSQVSPFKPDSKGVAVDFQRILPRGDLNGDGVKDWLSGGSRTYGDGTTASFPGYFYNAEGNSAVSHDFESGRCGEDLPVNNQSGSCSFADFNLDGRTDTWSGSASNSSITLYYTQLDSNNSPVKGAAIDTGIVAQRDYSMTTSSVYGYTQPSLIPDISDYNGDGLPDLLVYNQRQLKIYLHNGNVNGTNPYTDAGILFHTHTTKNFDVLFGNIARNVDVVQSVGDIDGNGLPDFLILDQYNDEDDYFYPTPQPQTLKLIHHGSNGIYFTTVDISGYASNVGYSQFFDVNGDGLADYLYWDTSNGQYFRINKGNGSFGEAVFFDSSFGDIRLYQVKNGYEDGGGQATKKTPLHVKTLKYSAGIRGMDVNGDGRQDLLIPTTRVIESCVFHEDFPVGAPDRIERWFCGDELYGKYWDRIQQSGNTWFNVRREMPGSAVDEGIYQFDVIYFNEQADGTITTSKADSGFVGPLTQAASVDAFGNGLTDLVFTYGPRRESVRRKIEASQESNHAVLGRNFDTYVYRNRGSASGENYAPVDMLQSVTNGTTANNGMQLQSSWVYRPLSTGEFKAGTDNFYDPDFAATDTDPDYFNFTSSMYTVAQFNQSNGVGGTSSTKYRYNGAMYNNKGRGFQGFNSIIVDSPSDTRSVSEFHQKFPLSGQIEAIRTCLIADSKPECADGFLSKTTKTYHQTNTANSSVHWIVPHVSTQTQYALNNRATELSTSTTTIEAAELDTYGNIKKTVSTVNNGFSTVKTTVVNDFDTSAAGWRNKLNWTSVQTETMSGSAIYDAALDPVKKVKTSYTWTSARLPDVVTVTPELGGGKTTEVDTDYNAYGLPTKVSTYESGSTDKRAVETKYSADGENLSTDGKGYFVYQVINDKDHVVTTKTYPTHGQVKSVTSNSLTTTTEYDAFGRVEKITPPADSGQPSYLRYATCNNGCDGLSDTNIRYKVTTYSAGAPESVEYKDQLNRVIYSKTEGFDGTAIFVKAQYDNLGRMTFESIPSGSASETLGTTYDSYDALGRLTKKSVSQPYNNKMEVIYAYSGHLTSISATDVINGVTNSMSRTYSGNGQLMQTSQYDGEQDIITQYAYDSSGNPIVLQDGNGNPIKAEYNALGQKKYVNDPNMGTKTFAYTGFGEVYSELDANGDTYYYAYDDLGRLQYRYLNVVPTPSNTSSAEASFSYDSQCEGLPDGETRLNLPAGESFSKSYGYDAWCRPFETITNIDGTAYKVSTQYDGNYGRVKAVTYPTGLTVENVYNERGYLTQAKNAASGYVYHQIDKMDARGQLLEAKKANGVLTEGFEYWDETGQMKKVYTQTTNGASQRHRIEYSYDGFGNLKNQTVENKRNGQTIISKEDYKYDALHRLKISSRDIGGVAETDITYDYDKVGNLKKKDDYATSYVYGTVAKSNGNAGPNAVYSVAKINNGGTKTFNYDNNGNLLSGDGKTIAYNAFNKPVSINRNGVTSLFSYGADQMRYKQVKKGISGGDEVTRYVDKVYEEITHNGKTEKKLYLGDAIVTETVNSSDTSYKVGFVHRDRLGSVVTITDETGEVVDNKSYDPFGKPRKGTLELVDPANPATLTQIASLDGFELQTDRGFTDHEHLDDAELIHMNGRVYDYNLGRFLSVDPFIQAPGNSQSMNPYSYIMNNPLAGADPSGYRSICKTNTNCETIWVNPPEGEGKVIISDDNGKRVNQAPAAKPAETPSPENIESQEQVASETPEQNESGGSDARNSSGGTNESSSVPVDSVFKGKGKATLKCLSACQARARGDTNSHGRDVLPSVDTTEMTASIRQSQEAAVNYLHVLSYLTMAGDAYALASGIRLAAGRFIASRSVSANVSLVGAGDDLAKAANWLKPKEGYFDVLIHGSEKAFHVLHNGKWVQLTHRSLAAFIRKNGFTGQSIRLISCKTGACSSGAAQNLANKLGVSVLAPTKNVWIHPSGRMTIGSPSRSTGEWVSFRPGG
ncbi:FG-GAP-like repeat-containing protein [Aliikangiella coralliicola]|uniref:Teneurin-like YD-shell domain-containing protein n=1 Tax=Aliikangiella coralliicola TaxID=2592383 RepID=A0A545UB02_9GAMM|nr:FG-GAP-like repeat-containing protein [Aliikangiella coralliicola]TQV86654.1 hypothetical protein FLL46_17325 [Aliikangiella coralliicola]